MAIVTKRNVTVQKPVEETRYVLELTHDEACAFANLSDFIGGDANVDKPRRLVCDALFELKSQIINYKTFPMEPDYDNGIYFEFLR